MIISPDDDEYLAKLETELNVLKAMKGFTGGPNLGKFRKEEKICLPPKKLNTDFFWSLVLDTVPGMCSLFSSQTSTAE